MKNIKLTYILILLCLIPSVLFAQNFSTTNVDDYTKNNGSSSARYSFKIGDTSKIAINKGSSNMTWADWLSIIHDSDFNNENYKVITTNGEQDNNRKEAYIVSYNLNGGTSTVPNDDFVYAEESIILPSAPTRIGYTFSSWYNALSDGASVGGAGGSYTPTSDMTLYAQWTANKYKIVFHFNPKTSDYTDDTIEQEVIYNQTISLNKNEWGYAGFTFRNWTTSPDGSGTSYVDGASVSNLVSENNGKIDLYAQWDAGELSFSDQELTITYSKNQQTKKIIGPSNGSGNYKYELVSSNNNITLSEDGVFTIPSLNIGSYDAQVKVKDLNTSNKKTVKVTIKIESYLITNENTTTTLTPSSAIYSGSETKPAVIVKMNANTVGTDITSLTENTDFTLSYEITTDLDNKTQVNSEAGSHNIVVEGKGNYKGSVVVSYEITKKSINSNDIQIEYNKDHNYTGREITPDVKIIFNGKELVYGYDYDLTYSNNINVAKESDTNAPTVTITGKGNYDGSIDKKFNINANSLEGLVNITNGYAIYDGNETDGGANVSVNIENKDSCEIAYGDDDSKSIPKYTNAGSYDIKLTISCTGYSQYVSEGTILKPHLNIKIDKAKNEIKLNKEEISLLFPSETADIVYTTKFDTGVESDGSTHVTITPVDNEKKFTTSLKGTLGENTTEQVIVKTKETDNVESSQVILTVNIKQGKIDVRGNDVTTTYDGNSHSIDLTYTPNDASATYNWEENGESKTSNALPSFVNTGTYLVSYSLSKAGYESYYGTNKLTINPKKLTSNMVTISQKDTCLIKDGKYECTYTGNSLTWNVSVKDSDKTLTEGVDYYLEYSGNIDVGSNAQVKIIGIGNYTDSVSQVFIIKSNTIVATVSDGEAQYTGYYTIGTTKKAGVTVESPTTASVHFGTSQKCDDSEENKYCPYTSITALAKGDKVGEGQVGSSPIINVGTHTIYYKIEAKGYETIHGTLTITITKRYLIVPTAYGEYIYTGASQSPSWINYNTKFMEMSGDVKATNAGTYKVVWKLADKNNTAWQTDGEDKGNDTDDKTSTWTIQKIDVKSHETVVEQNIAYNETKQIEVADGQTSFKRTGYVQNGWVEHCEDKENSDNTYTRECSYDRYIKVTENGKEKDYTNLLDVGSSLSGSYVAEQVDYDYDKSYDIYAIWATSVYKVKYDLCDEKGCGAFNDENNASHPTLVSYDSAFNVTNPERTGYMFIGWKITQMDDSPHMIGIEYTTEKEYITPEEWTGMQQNEKYNVTIAFKNLTSVDGAEVKMTALWQPINYSIHFHGNKETYIDANGATTTANLAGSTTQMNSIAYNTTQKLSKNGFTLTGYTFTGWNTKADGSGTHYDDEQEISNLTTINGEVIDLYAQWKRNDNTKFTITYWKQKINAGTEHISANYDMVGKETYTGQTDANITITPYKYEDFPNNGTHSSNKEENSYIATTWSSTHNSDTLDKNDKINSVTYVNNVKNCKISVGCAGTKLENIKFTNTTNTNIKYDYFRGFTPETSGDNSNPSGTYTYTILPDGSRNINVYYTRNIYSITYTMNGGSTPNPTSRQYQVTVTFQDASSNSSLKNGKNDFGGTDQTGEADFAGWFRNKNITVQVVGVNGEVTTNEELFAKWLQYRYSGKGGNEQTWTQWSKSQE